MLLSWLLLLPLVCPVCLTSLIPLYGRHRLLSELARDTHTAGKVALVPNHGESKEGEPNTARSVLALLGRYAPPNAAASVDLSITFDWRDLYLAYVIAQ